MRRNERFVAVCGLVTLAFMIAAGAMISSVMAGDESEDYTLSFDPETVDIGSAAGGTFTVTVVLDTTTEIKGWQWGVCHDSDFFEDLAAETSAADNDGDTIRVDFDGLDTTFEALSVFAGEGWNCGGLMNVIAQTVIDVGVYDTYETTYTIADGVEPDTSTDLEFCALGTPKVTVAVIITGADITPTQESATINITPPPVDPFLRGDMNSNGKVEFITDALVLLQWAFTAGDPPACMDAADIDDNGVVVPLLEAILFIDWGFGNGGLEPAPPGIETCGEDPTDDEVDCQTLADLCE